MKRTRHFFYWLAGSLALLALLLHFQERVARAQNPLAVELDDFTVEWDPSAAAVLLEWTTATEFDSAGFQVRRIRAVNRPASTSELDIIPVTDDDDNDFLFIPAVGDGASGADYAFVDYGTATGASYWYFLVEIDFSGNAVVFDGISGADFARQIWATNATPTSTPSSLATPTQRPTGTVQPAATSTATPNGQATATPTGQASPTTVANATATPTAQLTSTSSGATATPSAQPTATNTSGGFSGPTPTPFSFGNPGNGDDAGEIAQVDATSEAYPDPVDEGDSTTYPGDEPPAPLATVTAYPFDEAATPAAIDTTITGTIGGAAYEAAPAGAIGNGATTTSAALGDTNGPGASSQSLLLWIGFVVALFIFAGGIFGSIILFTRRRAPQPDPTL